MFHVALHTIACSMLPYIPLHIKPFLHLGKVTKNLYPYFMELNKTPLPIEVKRSLEFKLIYTPSLWNTIYKLILNQLKKIIGTTNYLKKNKVMKYDLCRLCRESKATSLHLFSKCKKKTNDLWQNVQNWFNSIIKI